MHLTLCQTGIGQSRPPSEPWELLVPSSAVIAPMPHSSVCWQSRSPAPLSIDPTLLPLSKISQLRPRNLPDHQPPQQKYCHMLTCNAPSAALRHSWKISLSLAIIHSMWNVDHLPHLTFRHLPCAQILGLTYCPNADEIGLECTFHSGVHQIYWLTRTHQQQIEL